MSGVLVNERMENIFYSVIGKHAGESVEEIIGRKMKEVSDCGFSLWSAKIDEMSVNQVHALDKSDKVYVLCRVNKKANDPAKGEVCVATKMIGPNKEEKIIPEGVKSTYGEGKKYQAYVVKDYRILDEPCDFDFGKYETTMKGDTKASFKERFNCRQFQNTFGKLNEQLDETISKDISVVMELEYPFVVNIK